jgi:ATP-dependent DNA helicase RecQ
LENQIIQVLKKFWGHQSFRPLQEEIIQSVLDKKDTIALLPTGGGKSICFQVPAMAMDGVCLVITPLIALMTDQVQNLRKKGIPAAAITSALSPREIDIALDNAVHGGLKFLYISPERINTSLFQARVARMNINLVAVDEAHCISEWGHDFRPAYREIATIKELISERVPMIALTATATASVVADISEKLELKSPAIFKKSFVRENLIYVVQEENHKLNRMIKAIERLGGSGIVYVSTRRETLRQAQLLRANHISALPYHGGMSSKLRHETQNMWLSNKAQVIVATNAFGMGIDKGDVRFVVHIDLPNGLEAYFQEAGRAGRDGKRSYAICLTNGSDNEKLRERVYGQIPQKSEIVATYKALINYYQLATGSPIFQSAPFDLSTFSKRYGFHPAKTLHCLKYLDQEGLITLSDSVYNPSQVKILMNTKDLYSFEIGHPKLEPVLTVLTRSYEGIYDHPTRIDELTIARRTKSNYGVVRKSLEYLAELRVIIYKPHTDLPFISFPENRPRMNDLKIDKEKLHAHQARLENKMMAVIRYVENNIICRSRQLVSYFDDFSAKDCGKCDVCLQKKQFQGDQAHQPDKVDMILHALESSSKSLSELTKISGVKTSELTDALRWMSDNRLIDVDKSNRVSLVSQESI